MSAHGDCKINQGFWNTPSISCIQRNRKTRCKKMGGFRHYKGHVVPKFVQGMFIKLRGKRRGQRMKDKVPLHLPPLFSLVCCGKKDTCISPPLCSSPGQQKAARLAKRKATEGRSQHPFIAGGWMPVPDLSSSLLFAVAAQNTQGFSNSQNKEGKATHSKT